MSNIYSDHNIHDALEKVAMSKRMAKTLAISALALPAAVLLESKASKYSQKRHRDRLAKRQAAIDARVARDFPKMPGPSFDEVHGIGDGSLLMQVRSEKDFLRAPHIKALEKKYKGKFTGASPGVSEGVWKWDFVPNKR